MTEDFVHQSLVGRSSIFKAKWHDPVEVISVVCDESGFVHVGCSLGDLIVTEVCIKKDENLVNSRAINKSVNIGYGVGISGTRFIKIRVINTHPLLVVGFLNQDHVRKPSGIMSFFDEPYA